jgi:hypothetical protein
LVLKALLLHRGIAAELRIGVRTEPGGLAAHAWVEVRGRPVNDTSHIADVFTPLEAPVSDAVLAAIQ